MAAVPKGLTRTMLEVWTAVYEEGRDIPDVARERGVAVQVIHDTLRRALYNSAKGSLTERRWQEAAELRRMRTRLRERIDAAPDVADALPVVDRWAKLTEQQCKLEGLNAPVRVEVQDLTLLTDEQLRARWKEITGGDFTPDAGGVGPGTRLPDVGRELPQLGMGPEVRAEGVLQACEPGGEPTDTGAGRDNRSPPRGPTSGRRMGGK